MRSFAQGKSFCRPGVRPAFCKSFCISGIKRMKNSTNQTNFCNPLSQLDSFLISTEEFQENLSHAKSARILVFSDSHGNRQQLERILSYFSGHIDAIAFCGDGISDLL